MKSQPCPTRVSVCWTHFIIMLAMAYLKRKRGKLKKESLFLKKHKDINNSWHSGSVAYPLLSKLKLDSHLPKNCFICFNESPLKMKKIAFYFILKALFIFKMFKFLS